MDKNIIFESQRTGNIGICEISSLYGPRLEFQKIPFTVRYIMNIGTFNQALYLFRYCNNICFQMKFCTLSFSQYLSEVHVWDIFLYSFSLCICFYYTYSSRFDNFCVSIKI